MDRVVKGKLRACLAQQNLVEFIHVVTDPRQMEKHLLLPKALAEAEKFHQLFRIISPLESTAEELFNLIGKKSKLGKGKIFDLYLAATMLSNGVGTIYTFNASDFKDVPGITVKKPL